MPRTRFERVPLSRGAKDDELKIMLKLIILLVIALYVAPLSLVVLGFGVDEFLFLASLSISSFLAAWLVYATPTVSGNPKSAIDHSDRYVAPRSIIYICMASYIIFKNADIAELIAGLVNGSLPEIMLNRAIQRYSGSTSSLSLGAQLGTMTMFILFTGLGSRVGVGIGRSKRETYFFVMFIIFVFFVESMALARAGIMLALVCFATEAVIRKNTWLQRLTIHRYVKIGALGCIIALGVFMFSAYFRVYQKDNTLEILYEKFALYTIASYDLFFTWLNATSGEPPQAGINTFTFIWKFLGMEVQQGYYSPMQSRFGYGNIYLNLRGLVQDFGIVGAALFFSSAVFTIGLATYNRLGSVRFFILRAFLVILFFPLISPFNFANFAVAFIFSGASLIAFDAMSSARRRSKVLLDRHENALLR